MSLSPGEGGGGVLLTVTHFNSDEEEEGEEEGDLIYIPCKVIMFPNNLENMQFFHPEAPLPPPLPPPLSVWVEM